MIIEFEDNGQDFLRWKLDSEGKVIECTPFQSSAWVGKYVLQAEYLSKGDHVYCSDTPIVIIHQPLIKLKHRVKTVITN